MFTYINARSASLNNISKIMIWDCTLMYEIRKTSEVEIAAMKGQTQIILYIFW